MRFKLSRGGQKEEVLKLIKFLLELIKVLRQFFNLVCLLRGMIGINIEKSLPRAHRQISTRRKKLASRCLWLTLTV